jgi:hypothetical protein
MGYWEYDTEIITMCISVYYEPSEFDEKCEELKDYDKETAQKYADWLNDNECKKQ